MNPAHPDPSDSPHQLTLLDRLQRWRRQHDLHLKLVEAEQAAAMQDDIFEELDWPTFDRFPDGPLVDYSQLPTAAGEVRLLDSTLTPSGADLIHIAILQLSTEGGMATIVSASHYLDAATLFETTLQHPLPMVHALQVWNFRRLPISVLAKSWLVGSLHADDLAIANAVATAALRGVPPPGHILPHCGLPIRHPEDPRRDYLAEQSYVLDHLQSLGAEVFFAEEALVEQATATVPANIAAVPPASRKSLFDYIRSWLDKLLSGAREDSLNPLVLACKSPPLPIRSSITISDVTYSYTISNGYNDHAHVQVFCDTLTPELVQFEIAGTPLFLKFTQLGNYWTAEQQTSVPFSNQLMVTEPSS